MRIVSSNLQHGVPDPKGRPDLARSFGPLRALAGDVYALQELDRGHLRTGLTHQGEVLATALGGTLVWARAKRRVWATQANALVVRGEVLASELVRLPGRGERRVAVVARAVVRGECWSVATAHLSLDRATARQQLEMALRALAGWPSPHVLVGDLNLVAQHVVPVAVAAGFELVDGPPTVDARGALTRRLDHVLLAGAEVLDSGVSKLPLSDHLAVWADVDGPGRTWTEDGEAPDRGVAT